MMMTRPRNVKPAAGFALVLTLFVLSVLAIVAVSYLASMSAERATANAFANKSRAEAAARAGADAAMAILRENLRAFPDSVTAWDAAQAQSVVKQPDGATKTVFNEGTSLYLRAKPAASSPVAPDPAADNRPPNTNPAADNRRNFVLPLISGVPKGQARLVSEKGNIFPVFPASDSDPKDKDYEKTSTDLNVRRSANDKQGVIGSPPGWADAAPKPARAPWVELKDEAGLTLARYAFVVEDESFKVPVSLTGNLGERDDNRQQYRVAGKPRAVLPSDLSFKGPLLTLGQTDSAAGTLANKITDARANFPAGRFLEPRDLAQADTLAKPLADSLRFLASTESGALNLSRHGTQRVNLNGLVPAGTAASDVPLIQRQVNQLVATLRFHLPNLGQRFYRTGAGTDSATLNANAVTVDNITDGSATPIDRPSIYFYKVAANLRDQLDADSVPTVILAGGAVRPNARPLLPVGDEGTNGVWAQGKDAAPFIQEAAVRFRGGPNAGNTTYRLSVDYYVEVWNMSSRDVSGADLGPNPFLRINNPTRWLAYDTNGRYPDAPLTSSDPAPATASPSDTRVANQRGRDYDLDISGVTFRAGVATVITTDPDYRDAGMIAAGEARNNVYVCSFTPINGPGKRVFNGPMPTHANPSGGSPVPYNGLRMRFETTGSSDYETEVIFGNDHGYLDSSYGGLPIYNNGATSIVLPSTSGNPHPLFGGSFRGNGGSGSAFPSVTGDPRSLNEQIVYRLYSSGGNPDQNSRFFNFGGTGHTLGLPNTDFVQPQKPDSPYTPWPDWCLVPGVSRAADAPAVVANGLLTSIGQLGDVSDPARQPTSFDNLGINSARGGGRTFRLGQRDDRFHADPTGNPPATNQADAVPNSNGWAAWRLADVFGLSNDLRVPGAVNLNGVPRDGGAALRTALTGFRFQPRTQRVDNDPAKPIIDPLLHGDTSLTAVSTDLSADSASALVKAITARLANTKPANNAPAGPFFERGEFGELDDVTSGKPLFGRTYAGSPLAENNAASATLNGVNMNRVADRGREEVFRRLAEVVCTRGDTFTVHAVGQSLTPPDVAGRRRVTATQRLRLTFRLVPKQIDADGKVAPFLPGSTVDSAGATKFFDFDPRPGAKPDRFTKPEYYDAEILQASLVQ